MPPRTKSVTTAGDPSFWLSTVASCVCSLARQAPPNVTNPRHDGPRSLQTCGHREGRAGTPTSRTFRQNFTPSLSRPSRDTTSWDANFETSSCTTFAYRLPHFALRIPHTALPLYRTASPYSASRSPYSVYRPPAYRFPSPAYRFSHSAFRISLSASRIPLYRTSPHVRRVPAASLNRSHGRSACLRLSPFRCRFCRYPQWGSVYRWTDHPTRPLIAYPPVEDPFISGSRSAHRFHAAPTTMHLHLQFDLMYNPCLTDPYALEPCRT